MIPMLERIAEKSRDNPDMVFTSIGHLINVEMLKQCFRMLDGKKAVGIDGVTKEDYGQHLEENLEDLVRRLKEHSYVPKPAKRVCIPKDNGKMRPLAIYSFEDKLMQQALTARCRSQLRFKRRGSGTELTWRSRGSPPLVLLSSLPTRLSVCPS